MGKDRKRLATIVSYFEDSEKKVRDLENLLSTTNEKNVSMETPKWYVGFIDALVVLACADLSNGEAILQNYCIYTRIKPDFEREKRNAFQNLRPGETDSDIDPGILAWAEELKKTGTRINRETPLAEVLIHVINVAQSRVPKDDKTEAFIKFLTDVQSGKFLSGQSKGGQAMGKYSAMDKVRADIKSSAKNKKCIIFTGAPGTGKTYCVEKYVKGPMEMYAFERKEYFVQFHSSYDYTDFVEGLRPIQVDSKEDDKDVKKMVFVRMDGIFKAFCRKVVEWNEQYDLNNKPARKNLPTSAKIGDAEEDHSESDVELLSYETPEGKKLPYYYFVIDEINRADLGQVFGELMYCFEKRGEEHSIATQYANLPTYGKDGKLIEDEDKGKVDCFKDGFYIPDNVVIIGTMNDIDRSVETFDFALRRRFDWVEIEADEVMETSLISMLKELKVPDNIVPKIVSQQILDQITRMNKKIADQSGLGPEFKIGPAYFKDLKYYDVNKSLEENIDSVLKPIWERNIKPILREYMRGRQGSEDFVKKCRKALYGETAPGPEGNQE